MWFMLIYLQVPALQAAWERIALRGSASPCQGRLEVYYQNQWGLVGFHEWNHKNGEVVCKSLGCGSHKMSGYAEYRYPPNQAMVFWMDHVRCSGKEESLWKCKFIEWNVTQWQMNNFVVVECTGNIILSLNHNGRNNMCAGVVQFQGPNFTATVCNRDWDANKADMVCRELQCGSHHKIPKGGTFLGDRASHYVPLSCDNEKFSWQCVNWVSPKPNTCHEEANVICSDYVRVRLRGGTDVCNGTLEKYKSPGWDLVPYTADSYKMAEDICSKLMCGKSVSLKPHNEFKNIWLTCSDRIKVELVSPQQISRCDGDVYVSINASRRAVCSEGMNEEELQRMGQVVCRELRCEKLLVASKGNQGDRRLLSHVDCHGNEDSLWECLAKYNTGPSCKTVKVSCTGSVDVRLKDGLDRCSGRLEMQYGGSWWSVTETPDWRSNTSDVVCGHLNCGKSFITEANLFVNGKLPVLKRKLHCENSSTHISRCFMNDGQPELKKTVNIICTREEIWFLQGNSSCEGRVKVEAAGKSRLLTEEDTWNNETAAKVCERLLCGSVRSFTPESNGRGDSDSSDCSANSTSFSKCSNETATSSSISCSGSVEVRLDNKCWGKVLVCTGDRCGGVCRDTWKHSHSRTLCRSLGCGGVIGEYHGPIEPNISVSSIHCPEGVHSLGQCNFVLMSNASNCQIPANIACAGSLKVALRDHRDECAGRAEIFFLGRWRPVCESAFAKETRDALCMNVGCGDSVSFKGDGSKALGLLQFTCRDGDISSCNFTRAELQECFLGHLTCTNWSRVLLTNLKSACTGYVFELRGGILHALNEQDWAEQNHARLCDTLQCGNGSHDTGSLVLPRQRGRSHRCRETGRHIWNCAVRGDHRNSTNFKHLNVRCKDEPSVSLLGNCTGELRIGQNEAMCMDSQNTEGVFRELCHQLGCSMYFTSWASSTGNSLRPAVPTRRFSCTGLENRLWQCSSQPADCSHVVSVACLDGVEFRLTEQCVGELQVRYRGYWQPVCAVKMVDADVVCEKLRCGKALKSGVAVGSRTKIKMSFSCEGKKHPKHCLQISTSCREGPALIHCEKHVVKVPPNHGLTHGLPVGLSLILVSMAIVFWQRKRFLFILRLRRSDRDVEKSSGEISMDLPGRKSSMIEMDKYEDVCVMRLAEDSESRSQGEDEKDSSSGDSSGTDYDDVDEANIEPLLPACRGPSGPPLPPRPAHLLGEDEKDSSSGDSAGTDYDDVDEANIEPLLPACRGPSEPPLPPRPAHLLGDVDYKEELKEKEDYDDVMSLPAGVSAKKCSSSLLRPLADAALVVPDNQTKPRGKTCQHDDIEFVSSES